MHPIREGEILKQLLSKFNGMNRGPGQNMPIKTLWLQMFDEGKGASAEEFNEVIQRAVTAGLLTQTPSGPGNLGSVAQTDSGYEQSPRS